MVRSRNAGHARLAAERQEHKRTRLGSINLRWLHRLRADLFTARGRFAEAAILYEKPWSRTRPTIQH